MIVVECATRGFIESTHIWVEFGISQLQRNHHCHGPRVNWIRFLRLLSESHVFADHVAAVSQPGAGRKLMGPDAIRQQTI